MDVASLLQDIGFTIPTGIAGVMMVCFIIYMKSQERRQDKDRAEHMAKWETMVAAQKDAATAQGALTDKMIGVHQSEMDRQFKLHERNSAAVESLTHHLSIITRELNKK